MSEAAHKKSYLGEYVISPGKSINLPDTLGKLITHPLSQACERHILVEPGQRRAKDRPIHLSRLHGRVCLLLPDWRS